MWNAIFRHDRKFGAICHKEEPKTVGKIGIFRDLKFNNEFSLNG